MADSVGLTADRAPVAIATGDPLPQGFDDTIHLPTILRQAAQTSAGIRYIHADGSEHFQSYAALLEDAERILAGLQARGVQAGDRVILQLSHSPDFVAALWGCFLGGMVPVPIAPALRYTHDNSAVDPVRHALTLLDQPFVVTEARLYAEVQAFLKQEFHDPGRVLGLDDLRQEHPQQEHSVLVNAPDDLALVLLTSGSTGTPKGVMLSARNLVTSAYGMATVNELTKGDRTLNWMPLEHVASLVMFHFTPLYLGCQQIHVAHGRVLHDPLTWLDLLTAHRVTATWAPNFAYGLVNDQIDVDEDTDQTSLDQADPGQMSPIRQRQWDLSSVRWMGNGAEAVVGKTTRRFLRLLAPHGLSGTAVSPGYGMSETCSGIVHSHRFSLNTTADEDAFVEVGQPIPGVSLRIVDEGERPVSEGTVGRLQVQGPTLTLGYYGRPELTAEVFTNDGWFNTGDLGFLRDGRLTLTGRQKEAIIINGVNYYSHDIEAVVEEVEGVEVSFTAACAVRRPDAATDQLAIFFSSTLAEAEKQVELLRTIRTAVIRALGISPTYLIPVEPAVIPKTNIGKIQRSALSQRFAAGEFDLILQQVAARLKAHSPSRGQRPTTELEQQIAALWQEVLKVEAVGLHDNFFELGGNSVKLMQVLHRLPQRSDYPVTAVELFQYPTVAALARYLGDDSRESVRPDRTEGRSPLRRRAPAETGVAVVGMACRFPEAPNLDAFWQNLCDGVESITFFSDEELRASGIPPSLIRNPNYVKASPILEEVECFDAEFFGYSPKEAELMDPQQRLLLECAWECLEHAGYDPFAYDGRIGLYAGASMNTYLLNHVYPNRHQLDPHDPLQVMTLSSMGGFQMAVANDKDYLTTRVSYKLNLRGPSVNVQTACSTSLVAIHLAAQSVLSGECEMALAGGVSVETPQKAGHLFQDGMILSPDGHCRAFDAQARGTLFGSGVGLVVLKRLDEAIAQGDTLYAVIKGSAIGNDGSMKVGYLAPRSEGQTAVATEAMAIANIDANTIGYVEAHGTGTELGDPIEIAGLTQAFRTFTQNRQFCAIGSVKTNVGHLNIASGVVGFIKTVLALHHEKLPPSLHFETPNPQIDFTQSPFYVNTALTDWPRRDTPRRAGVNSLGIGGTNVHVVLEEAPVEGGRRKTEGGRRKAEDGGEFSDERQSGASGVVEPIEVAPHLLTLSARSAIALQHLAERYVTFLNRHPDVSLADLCFTANVGRSPFPHRLAVVTESVPHLRDILHTFTTRPDPSNWDSPNPDSPSLISGRVSQRPTLAFLFTGQGSQYPQMGRHLYDTQPVFRDTLNHCAYLLNPHLDTPLLDLLYPPPSSSSPPSPSLNQTAYTQPALFALDYALAQLWLSWGIRPAAVMGHSIGEYVAACLAGVFSLDDALKLIAARGRLMQALPHGGMVSVLATEAQVNLVIAPYRPGQVPAAQSVSIAAINGPQSLVISGHPDELQAVIETLTQQGIKTKPLTVSHAFHSAQMEPMLDAFKQVAETVTYHLPQLDLVSNLTGDLAADEIASPDYWCRHIRQPIQFAAGMTTLHRLGCNGFLECGPKPLMLGMGQLVLEDDPERLWIPSLNPKQPDSSVLLQSLSALVVRGVAIAWDAFYAHTSHTRIPLPTYPFQRQRHWLDTPLPHPPTPLSSPTPPSTLPSPPTPPHPLLGSRHPSPSRDILFDATLTPNSPPFLTDHRLHGRAILPGTAYLELILAAGTQVLHTNDIRLCNVDIQQALWLPNGEPPLLQTMVQKTENGATVAIFSCSSQAAEAASDEWTWTQHCTATLAFVRPDQPEPQDLTPVWQRLIEERSPTVHYQTCAAQGLDYGPTFRGIQQLWRRDGEALGLIQLPNSLKDDDQTYHVHPALLDACFQAVLAALPDAAQAHTYLPVHVDCLRLYRTPGARVWSHVKLHDAEDGNAEQAIADVRLIDDTGAVMAQVTGLTAKRVPPDALLNPAQAVNVRTVANWSHWLYRVEWRPQPLLASSSSRKGTPRLQTRPAPWLILADTHGLAQAIAACLTDVGQSCILIPPFPADIQESDDLQSLLEKLQSSSLPVRGILSLWSLDTPLFQDTDSTALPDTLRQTCRPILHLIQTLLSPSPPPLYLLTHPSQTPLTALRRVLEQEAPDLTCIQIELDAHALSASALDNTARALVDEWMANAENAERGESGDRHLAFLNGVRHVPRLVPASCPVRSDNPTHNDTLQLQIPTRGTLDALTWQAVLRRSPTAGEVELRVEATGLNFRDVLNALGLYPGDPGPLGLECAGTVVAVGPDVQGLAVGDAVVAIAPASFSQFVTVSTELVTPRPPTLTAADAATLPVTFLTAYYALCQLAKLKPGDRVLIHAAAGGVGQAAVQLAQQVGAEIFATASPGKWAFLHEQGIRHVMNSRTLEFAEAVRAATQGEGVQVVLNSLSGDFIVKSLSVLAEGGHFLEIGKADIWSADQMAQARPDVTYRVIDLVEVTQQHPEQIQTMLQHLMPQFDRGNLRPLPHTAFPMTNAVDAFRYMQQAKHVGKIVVTQEKSGIHPSPIRSDGTYLVTGGLGGLGLQVAAWLAERGAGKLLLVSRRSPAVFPGRLRRAIADTCSTTIETIQADVSNRDELAQILAPYRQATGTESPEPPLRGVFHLAGVLDDGTISQQTWDRFEHVMAPKAWGAAHLHDLTTDLPLDHFVLFSSAASLLGSAGQANYAAANGVLDAIAHQRRAMGLPGLSINWGGWSQVGMAAHSATAERLARSGMALIEPSQGLVILEHLLAYPDAQVGVLPVDWSQWQRQAGPHAPLAPFLSEVLSKATQRSTVQPSTNEPISFKAQLEATPEGDRPSLLKHHLRQQVARVLGLDPATLTDDQQGFTDLGLDSLTSVELRNRLQTSLGHPLSATLVYDYPTLAAMTTHLLQILLPTPESSSEEEPKDDPDSMAENASDGSVVIDVDSLSEEEAEALLLQELERLQD